MTDRPEQVKKTVQDITKISKEDLMPGIPNNAMPTPEFIATVERIEKAKATTLPLPPNPAVSTPIQPHDEPKVVPVVLQYKYSGTCYSCGTEVETLIVNVGRTMSALAWCSKCKKTITQQNVKPLTETKKEVNKHGDNELQKRLPVSKKV